MIKYDSELKQICLEAEAGEPLVITKEAMEAVCAYFYDNYGTYENVDGKINYEYKS